MDNWQFKMDAVIASNFLLKNMNVIDITFTNGQELEVYVALNQRERSIGLSTIPYLDVDGMLFYYEKPSYNPFSVKDMGFDLSIGFYNELGECVKSGDYPAGDGMPIYSPKKYSYVVETRLGQLPKSNLKVNNVKAV